MLNKIDIEFCNNIRRYGKFIKRYDKQEDKNYNDTDTILVYKYNNLVYYLVMYRGKYLDYFEGIF